ncbi:5-formyltetrahydrofolate cyclo-ligase [Acetobacterium bakii]|uniref:5-formyltetrahydrofolate cyclo-ligase n=1 Tax=Acetobacterium bakii TaxID=52689 RepID=A0A0L6U4E6_9FIRM|nr:5-formyltetrahydrofolate cyclo-ligase [Acetobacterium bakii]KNZ43222.1 5-formyltetrahydrofolate cyclo-ligase [Acetobacterium bakii]
MDKSAFRKEILAHRKAVYCATTDAAIINKFLESDLYEKAEWIMVYVSFGTEIYTHDFIEKALADGKHVVAPICNISDHTITLSEIKNFPEDLEEGHYGILEVRDDCLRIIDPKQLDLVMVPGCAFSHVGHRMGFGGGYYDRFLETINDDCITVALIRDDFIFDEIPMEAHDKSVDYMITEKCLTCCPIQEA